MLSGRHARKGLPIGTAPCGKLGGMRWLSRRPSLALFLGAFLVYNLNLRPVSSGDTAPAALLPLAVWLEGKITFERYAPLMEKRLGKRAWFFVEKGGRRYSYYPIAQPLLLLPLNSPLALVRGLGAWPVERLVMLARSLEKLEASLLAALAVALLYRLARRYTGRREAVWLSLLFAFATSTWSISSQALWQHGMGQLLIIASLLCLDLCLAGEGGFRTWVGAGLCAALSAAVRPTNALFVAACCLVLMVGQRWKLVASYVGFSALVGGAVAAYNLTVFERLSGGYPGTLGGNVLAGLAGLLFSPARGLLVYSPVLIFLLPAVWLWPHGRWGSVPRICVLFAAAHLLVHAAWRNWWGGDCFGPRLLTEMMPALVLLMAPAVAWLERNRSARTAFLALTVISVFVQAVGAFCYPTGQWYARPRLVDASPDRLWDWRDNPVRRDLSAGVDRRGYAGLAELVSAKWGGRRSDLERIRLRRE
ncbi:MAG: hypothetical protein FJW34_05015 [Acidobacteria bacterium]|nr:hypothetical protein [Acidobacteriota bacterium]